MISTVLTIANNSFKETIRNKVLYNIMLFVGLIIGLSVSFGQWSVFARLQVMNDFGLATISISSLLLAVFVGSSMLGKELSGKTIYLTATRPIARGTILWGKFLGLLATLFLNFTIMSLFLWIAIKLAGGHFTALHIKALVLLFTELGVILSASLLFSVLSSPTLAAIFTIGFYIIGHLNDLVGIESLGGNSQLIRAILKVINSIIPNLEQFNIRSIVVYNGNFSLNMTIATVLYGVIYIVIALILGSIFFEKKDL